MRHTLLILSLLVPAAATAQTAPDPAPAEGRQVCEAKADQNGITGDNRATYLRECEAGERLVRGDAPR
ncbi:hypothetical protein [Methylobacterium frigidaeris]|uniref:PsiF repeat-containing protein n=1 Tax=Methylobacterium frigidaeris TaxID=2038277 RepID=A0AA37H747_9HYPH|nr:hypothetical protein [Methylobacterium frigidaeris]PIK71956.1 hypothetical protein CS379_16610 [Methylobacterium frigidaeris]GJD60515.1 hypothetical protein MPEAHAMD_0653 [Methylobacterium frigidaeris]